MRDLFAVLTIVLIAAIAILSGMAASLLCHWTTLVFARAGAVEQPAAWIAYLITLGLLGFVLSAVCGRVVNGSWWFLEP